MNHINRLLLVWTLLLKENMQEFKHCRECQPGEGGAAQEFQMCGGAILD